MWLKFIQILKRKYIWAFFMAQILSQFHDIPLLISRTIFYSIRYEYPLLFERMIDKSM
jgi:hypothetical protein